MAKLRRQQQEGMRLQPITVANPMNPIPSIQAPRAKLRPADFGLNTSKAIGSLAGDVITATAAFGDITAKLKQRKQLKEGQALSGLLAIADNDWARYIKEQQAAPHSDMPNSFITDFDKYKAKLLETMDATTDDRELKEAALAKLEVTKARSFNNILLLQASHDQQNYIKALNEKFVLANDLIALTNDPAILSNKISELEFELAHLIEGGAITNPKVIDSFQQSLRMLPAEFAEHVLAKDPVLAKTVLDAAEGIPIQIRTKLEGNIAQALNTTERRDSYQLDAAANSLIEQALVHGTINQAFNFEDYRLRKGDKAADTVLARLDSAVLVYSATQSMQGQSLENLNKIADAYKPKENSINFARERTVHQAVEAIKQDQIKKLTTDGFAYARQDPVVNELAKLAEENPENLGLRYEAIDAAIDHQVKLGTHPDNVKVMTMGEAKQWGARFNSHNAAEVKNPINELIATYGRHYDKAFQQLASGPKADRVSVMHQQIAMHLDAPWIDDFTLAMSTKDSDFAIGDVTDIDFDKALDSDPIIKQNQMAILGPNPGLQGYVTESNHNIKKYAKQILSRGQVTSAKEAISMAAERVISRIYAFGEFRDQPYAIPRQIEMKDGTIQDLTDTDIEAIDLAAQTAIDDIDVATIDFGAWLLDEDKIPATEIPAVKDEILQQGIFLMSSNDNKSLKAMGFAKGGVLHQLTRHNGTPVTIPITTLLAHGRQLIGPRPMEKDSIDPFTMEFIP